MLPFHTSRPKKIGRAFKEAQLTYPSAHSRRNKGFPCLARSINKMTSLIRVKFPITTNSSILPVGLSSIMPSEKLLRLDPCSPRGPFVDHIPSISRLLGGIRILQGMISVGMLGISVAVLVVRDGDGLLVNAMVLAGWPLVHFGRE